MNIHKLISIVENQESLLQFPHFNRKDAWELGQLMSARIQKENLALAASIRLSNGFILFQHAPEGTNANNENWMRRKFNVVRTYEISSLHLTLRLQIKKETLEDNGIDSTQYVTCGGGFPIHVEGTGVIGAVLVSGLPHLADHDFLVDSISRFLKIENPPRFPLNVKI